MMGNVISFNIDMSLEQRKIMLKLAYFSTTKRVYTGCHMFRTLATNPGLKFYYKDCVISTQISYMDNYISVSISAINITRPFTHRILDPDISTNLGRLHTNKRCNVQL